MDKLTEAQLGDYMGILKTNDASLDLKISCINELKYSIKHYHVPDFTVSATFDLIRTAMVSQHSALAATGFSALGHLFKRLSIQEPKHIAIHGPRMLPAVLDRLGDQRERLRALATQCLGDLWKACPQEVERAIRDSAMVSKNPRTKEAAMHWILQMSQEQGLHIRGFVPKLIDLLEDADGMVRDTAKATVVELFQHAPQHAKADLKKQLQQRNVRKSILLDLLSQLNLSGGLDQEQQAPIAVGPHPEPSRKAVHPGDHVNSDSYPLNGTALPESDIDRIEPEYVRHLRDFDEIFRNMHVYFEGRETEQNWLHREKSVLRLRRLTKGNALRDFHAPFLAGIKSLLDGILKCVNSLRTTLSSTGCSLVQELARAAGPGLDPMVEIMLQNLIKLCGGTKKISSQNGNVTVDAIFANVSYSTRLLQHIWGACQDKNVQPRSYATGWLKTIIIKHSHHRSQLEHSGGFDYVEKCIKKGLADANPGVREGMRKTYWVYAGFFSDKAEVIMSSLDVTSRRLLERDPANPNAGQSIMQSIDTTDSSKPSFTRSTTAANSRSTLKETIAARKKEVAATRKLPPRPGSAQSILTQTTKTASSASTAPSGFASAPIRPARAPKRPELSRPATAEPWSMRRPTKPGSPSGSSAASTARSKSKGASPRVSPVKAQAKKRETPPTSPSTSSTATGDVGGPSSAKRDEDLTMLMPLLRADKVVMQKTPKVRPVVESIEVPLKNQSPPSVATPRTVRSPQQRKEHLTRESSHTTDSSEPLEEIETDVPNGAVSSKRVDMERVTPVLKVYEDPVVSPERNQSPGKLLRPTVLGELTVNEPVSPLPNPASPMPATPYFKKMDISPRRKAMLERPENLAHIRHLIDSGIARVRAGSLDTHGFRRLQDLIQCKEDVWPDATKYGELLLALLDYLEAPPEEVNPEIHASQIQELRIQVLAIVRVMLASRAEYFTGFAPQVLRAVLNARKLYGSRSHMVSALEETAEQVCRSAPADVCIAAALEAMEEQGGQMSKATVCMGFGLLGGALRNRPRQPPLLSDEALDRLGAMAMRFMDNLDPDIRRGVMTYCVDLYDRVEPKSRFWRMLRNARDDHRSLITYYLAKRERRAPVEEQEEADGVLVGEG